MLPRTNNVSEGEFVHCSNKCQFTGFATGTLSIKAQFKHARQVKQTREMNNRSDGSVIKSIAKGIFFKRS